jgi:hypothetical protein
MPGQDDPVIKLYEFLLENPSVLGRLIYIANLWNPGTGRYDRGLPERFGGRPEVEKAVSNWHQAFFIQWLALPITEKERDVALYWRSIGGNRDQIKAIREQGEAALPPLVRSEERKFFIQDLSFILATL